MTERWVAENLQNSDLLPMTQVTLKAANGLEIPYSGVDSRFRTFRTEV